MQQYPNPLCDKNHNSIAFHKVHEAISANIIQVTKDASETNLADFLTKPLTGKKRNTSYVPTSCFRERWIQMFRLSIQGDVLLMKNGCIFASIILPLSLNSMPAIFNNKLLLLTDAVIQHKKLSSYGH